MLEEIALFENRATSTDICKGSGLHTTQRFSFEIDSRLIDVNDVYGGCNIGLPVSGFELRVQKRESIYLAVK